MRIAIVGPTRAGKTVYLAALMLAGFARRVSRAITVRADRDNASSLQLENMATGLLCGDVPPATFGTTTLDLLADLPGSRLFDIGKETASLQLVDVPGGECFPPTSQPVNAAVAASVSTADTLMIVVPADKSACPTDLDERVLHLASAAAFAQRERVRTPFFARAAVTVSMAELLVPKTGGALEMLEALDPMKTVMQLCGRSFLTAVRSLVPRGGDWYSLVSAYGFDLETGGPAAELVGGEWRLRTDGARFRDSWHPYRVFEPVEFLARGTCWREPV